MDSLKEQLMIICIEFLDKIASTESSSFYGTPPQVFYIDFGYGTEQEVEMHIGNPLETYRYANGVIEMVSPGHPSRREPVSRMYWPEGRGRIGIDTKDGFAYVSYDVGPRYGRGYRFKIIDDNGTVRLGDREERWVS